jgi:hypothetical protein
LLAGHLAVNTLLKFQRGSLGLNNTTPLSSHVFNFALLQTRSSAQRPPFNSSSALRDVTDCRYHPLPHHFHAHSHSLSQACLSQTLSRTCFSLRHCSCQLHLQARARGVWIRPVCLLNTCLLLLSEYFEAFASLPRPCLYSSDLASTARLSVRPSSYLPFA